MKYRKFLKMKIKGKIKQEGQCIFQNIMTNKFLEFIQFRNQKSKTKQQTFENSFNFQKKTLLDIVILIIIVNNLLTYLTPMDKLSQVRRQKQQLRKKIISLQGQNIPQNQLTQQAMALLYQKKAKLQHQRLQQQKYKKLQQQYNERKQQMQRQKQLQRIKNQKRMIQLQVGMKRIVLNGVQQKVKGINSDQLLTRALLNDPQSLSKNKSLMINKQKSQVKKQLQKYLQKQNIKKLKPKHDVYELNEKRFSLFQKKQELLMREILLKQFINNEQHEVLEKINILSCPKQDLQRLLQDYGIDIDEYMHPLNPKDILDNYSTIQQNIKNNIAHKRDQLEQQERQQQKYIQTKQQLKKWLASHADPSSIQTMQQIIDQILYNMIFQYEKRHYSLTSEQKQQKIQQLKKDYQKIQFQNQYYDMAEEFVSVIENFIKEQIVKEAAEETHGLWEFAHQMTQQSLDWMFNKKNFLEYRSTEKQRVDLINLEFKQQAQNVRYDKNQKNNPTALSKDNKDQMNVFQTQKNTQQLINDLKLLSSQQQYFTSMSIQIKRQVIETIDQNDFKLHNQNGLYIVSSKGIKELNDQGDVGRNVIVFQKELKNIKNVKKFNNIWVVQCGDRIEVYSAWNKEKLQAAIGQRINSPCGNFTNLCIYPTFSLLGSLCSVLICFQKGQVMKYNFNRNRINSRQSNITHYMPLGPLIKTGDEPAFPLNNRNVIEYKNQKVKDTQSIHQFRQFFDHHSVEVINVCYFKDNYFITVDKQLNCVIWLYDMRRGVKSYEPFYIFHIRSQYKVYKESQNPRFSDLYPSPNIKQTPSQLYKKWMQHQSYLKLQIYNNPKKSSAFFKPPKFDQTKTQQPLWKLNYDEKSKQVIKIFQTYYNIIDGKIQCKEVKIWREYLVFLIQREHTMRNDLKTIKFYLWSIEEKKLRDVAIQFDTFQEQKIVGFSILEYKLDGSTMTDYPILLVISSGKILFFSLISGQLLKDVSQQPQCARIKNYNFNFVQRGFANNFYGITRKSIVQFVIKNKNNKQKKQQFNKTIQLCRKKYNNLI